MLMLVSFLPEIDSTLSKLLGIDFSGLEVGHIRPVDIKEYSGLVLGGGLLLLVGVLDDRFGIRGRQKLLGQILAATVLIIFGYHFDSVMIAGIHFKFGIFSIIFVYLWVLAAVNSVNLLDGADGVASTIGILMCLSMCVMMCWQGKLIDAMITISISGALVGFLRFNFPPAKVYLGDAGSMLIGFLLAALAMRSTFKQNATYAFLAPVTLLAIPFIDTAAAIIRRAMTGRSIFAVDRGHLHHRLMKQGYSPQKSLLWVALLCSLTAAGGALALINHQAEYAIGALVAVVIVMLTCQIFGLAEFTLVARKAYSVSRALVPRTLVDAPSIHETSHHVQGSRDWQTTWQLMCEFADQHGLLKLTMSLDAPWLHESFHAKLKSAAHVRESSHIWHSEVPMVVEGKVFGRIRFSGPQDSEFSHHFLINEVLALTQDIEASLEVASHEAPAEQAAVAGQDISSVGSPSTPAGNIDDLPSHSA